MRVLVCPRTARIVKKRRRTLLWSNVHLPTCFDTCFEESGVCEQHLGHSPNMCPQSTWTFGRHFEHTKLEMYYASPYTASIAHNTQASIVCQRGNETARKGAAGQTKTIRTWIVYNERERSEREVNPGQQVFFCCDRRRTHTPPRRQRFFRFSVGSLTTRRLSRALSLRYTHVERSIWLHNKRACCTYNDSLFERNRMGGVWCEEREKVERIFQFLITPVWEWADPGGTAPGNPWRIRVRRIHTCARG